MLYIRAQINSRLVFECSLVTTSYIATEYSLVHTYKVRTYVSYEPVKLLWCL